MQWRSRQPEGSEAEPAEADLAPEVDAEVERCLGIVNKLSEAQQAWLDSCTSCGGSCDVYDCFGRVPEGEPAPFECDIGGPEPPPVQEEDEEKRKD